MQLNHINFLTIVYEQVTFSMTAVKGTLKEEL